MNNTSVIHFEQPSVPTNELVDRDVELIIYYIALVIGVTGNVLVLLSILSRGLHSLTPNDIFILNLAVSDLLVLVVFIPVSIYIRLAVFKPTIFFCKCTAPVITVALGGVILTLTVMAVHRWHSIANPFRHDMQNRTAFALVAAVWVICLALAVPKIILASPLPSRRKCVIMWPSPEYMKAYAIALFVIRFVIPFTLITFSYIKMGISLLSTQAPRFRTDSSGNIRDITNRKENCQVIKTLTAIIVLFLVCMLPYRVSLILRIFGWSKDPTVKNVYHISALLTIFHSSLNPLIYGAFLRRFRNDYLRFAKNIFCCLLCCKDGQNNRSGSHTSNASTFIHYGTTNGLNITNINRGRVKTKSIARALVTDSPKSTFTEAGSLLGVETKVIKEEWKNKKGRVIIYEVSV